MSVPTLYAGRGDRLIARIKCMLYAWRFIDQVDGQLVIVWPPLAKRYSDENVGYTPENLFDIPELRSRQFRAPMFVNSLIRGVEQGADLNGEAFASERESGFDRQTFNCDGKFFQKGTTTFRFKDEPGTSEHLKGGIVRLFHKLPVHPDIYKFKSAFYNSNALKPGHFAAIHVRRGDVYSMLQNELVAPITSSRLDTLVSHFVTRTAPSELYHSAIEAAIRQGQRIVFASDSPEAIIEFQELFGRDHFVDLAEMTLPIPIQKAFADFLVLSEASSITGTSSNFSVMPGELTGVPVSNIVGTGDVTLVRTAFEREILAGRRIDPIIATEALNRLDERYGKLVEQRAAVDRAQAARAHRTSLSLL